MLLSSMHNFSSLLTLLLPASNGMVEAGDTDSR